MMTEWLDAMTATFTQLDAVIWHGFRAFVVDGWLVIDHWWRYA